MRKEVYEVLTFPLPHSALPTTKKSPQRACKPGSVTGALQSAAGDHSSRTAVARRLQQPTRES